jgi:hypothetical protein
MSSSRDSLDGAMVRSIHRLLLICLAMSVLACASCSPNSKATDLPASGSAAVSADAPTEPEWFLEESETKYLWDLEHRSNILVKHGFGAIAVELQQQHEDALLRHLSEDFAGALLDRGAEIGVEDGVLSALRRRSVDGSSQPLARREFAAYLLDHRGRFTNEPRIRFDVKSISPDDRTDLLAGNWSALCVMRMWGDCGTDQPGETSLLLRVEFAQPTKERLAEPGWLLGCSIEQVATSQSSRFLFREVTRDYNIDPDRLADNWKSDVMRHNTGGIFACDFNRDSCVDVLVTDLNLGSTALMKGLPAGGFADVTAEVGLEQLQKIRPPFDAAFVDLDNDGWEDLVFSNGAIFKNQEGHSFFDFSSQTNLADVSRGFAAKDRGVLYRLCVADYDRDGWMDLYVIRSGGVLESWLEDTIDNPVKNLLLRNLGNWQFKDVTEASCTEAATQSAFTALWFDANNDLWPDLYVINEYGDGVLYVNEGDGSFRELDIDPTNADFGSMGLTAGDIDNDGNIDVYLASMYSKAGSRVIGNIPPGIYPAEVTSRLRRLISGSEFYQNEGDLSFHAEAEDYQIHDVGWAYGPTMADFNNDGFLDIFAPAGYMSRDRTKPDG